MHGEIGTVLKLTSGTVTLVVLQRHDPDGHPCAVYYTEEYPKSVPVKAMPFDERTATWVHRWGALLAQLDRYPWHRYDLVEVDDAFAARLDAAWQRRWATDPVFPTPEQRTQPVRMHNMYDWLPDDLSDRCVRWWSEIFPAIERHHEWRNGEAQRLLVVRRQRAIERRMDRLIDEQQ